MASTNQGIDMIIRKITAEQAVEMTPQLWARLKSLPPEDMLPQSKYIEILRYTARRILVKIEEAGFNSETWKSYTDFFTQAIVAYGTADMQSYLRIIERLLSAVLGFPSRAQPLLKEYLNCAVSQSTQRNAELAIYLAKHPTGDLPQLERQPDLEYDDNFVAVIEAKPVSEAMKILEKLPSQLSFAHRHAIMHLKLCNPLPIPGCAYVSTGYCCDTCHLRGIRVGFQAMLYDEEDGDAGPATSVRSDAQISKKKTYGFDICMACAVTFYAQQRELLFGLLRSPHKSYSFGHAAGVHITQARYHSRRRAVSSTSSSPSYPLSRQHSLTEQRLRPTVLSATATAQERRLSGQSCQSTSPSGSPSKLPAGDFGIHVAASNSSSCGSSAASTDSAGEKNGAASPVPAVAAAAAAAASASPPSGATSPMDKAKQPPPVRPPSRRISSGRGIPIPPATRCATEDVMCVSLSVTIAPYGARPIAWVLSRAEKFVHLNTMEEVLGKRIGPASQWRSQVKIEAASAQRRRRASAAAQAADGQFAARVSASSFQGGGGGSNGAVATPSRDIVATPASSPTSSPPLRQRPAGDSPRDLMETMSPLQAREALQRSNSNSYNQSQQQGSGQHACAGSSEGGDEEMCAICLCPFEGEEPVIETKCHHWFHVTCIEEYTRIAEDVCPLCRAEHALPDMSRATTLKNNAFKIVVELTEEQRELPYVDVCVGSVVTRDGNYRNATSIAAAQCVRVYPNQLRGYQIKSPVKATVAAFRTKA